jgi:xanthine dehydrogenase YagR molybdenum-binding subunit
MTATMGRQRFGGDGAIGRPIDRADGRLKVTGGARYTAEYDLPNLAYAALLQSTIARGRITSLDTSTAEAAPGVLAILSHLQPLHLSPVGTMFDGAGMGAESRPPLQDDRIHHAGQNIAVVVAETLEQAQQAARLIRVIYQEETPHASLHAGLGEAYSPGKFLGFIEPDAQRGDVAAGLAEADVRVEQTYTTPIEHHNPMEPSATIATWDEAGSLTVYDATQGVYITQQGLAQALGVPAEQIRVLSPFLGGGFGCKGLAWPHTQLAAVAARQVGRPVKLVLSRAQMYTSHGYRSETLQEVTLGARRDGTLTAMVHHSTSISSEVGPWSETAPEVTKILYTCPNLETSIRVVRLNLGVPTAMRAPGEAPGSFALESAMDELAYALGIDPIELRLRNFADVNPEDGKPWSSKALRACYTEGAERFGWARRTPEPRSMRDGRYLVGMGMATAYYPARGMPAEARVRLQANGRAVVETAGQDLGTGAYTIVGQIVADGLGLAPGQVSVRFADTALPNAGFAGGSMHSASLGPAVWSAAEAARARVLDLARQDEVSPLAGYDAEAIGVEAGELFLRHAPEQRESYASILGRHQLPEVLGEGSSQPSEAVRAYATGAFGAQFVEVRVDPDFGLVRISRALGVHGIGRVLNQKTARSQAIGGIIFGIGMGLLEESGVHPIGGRFISPNLSGYLVPVHADVPAIDAFFVDEPDPHINALGVKGVGEIGIVGVAAAIANAVFHATGTRVRDLPILPERLL